MLTVFSKEDIALFKDREVDLLIESYSNAAKILQIRGFTENAQIIADHTTSTDRSLATSTVSITGIPIMLTVRASTTGVKRGACYVKVYLRIEGIIAGLLGACYITDTVRFMWPGGVTESSIEGPGLIRSITGTNPAAGAEISETVPTGARGLLKSLRASLVTDATVANRYPVLTLDDGTTVLDTYMVDSAQAASSTRAISWHPQTPIAVVVATGVGVPISDNRILSEGYRIKTVTSGLVAGDNWGAPQLLVEEWIEP
jgi:hypothetical protein